MSHCFSYVYLITIVTILGNINVRKHVVSKSLCTCSGIERFLLKDHLFAWSMATILRYLIHLNCDLLDKYLLGSGDGSSNQETREATPSNYKATSRIIRVLSKWLQAKTGKEKGRKRKAKWQERTMYYMKKHSCEWSRSSTHPTTSPALLCLPLLGAFGNLFASPPSRSSRQKPSTPLELEI